jgi:hypothetical protein
MSDIYSVAAEFRRQLLEHAKTVARQLVGYCDQVCRRIRQQTDSLTCQIADGRAFVSNLAHRREGGTGDLTREK